MFCPFVRETSKQIGANMNQCGAQPTSTGEGQEVEEVLNPVKWLNIKTSKDNLHAETSHLLSPPREIRPESPRFLVEKRYCRA